MRVACDAQDGQCALPSEGLINATAASVAKAELGAHAVFNVSFGAVKIVPLSWDAQQSTGTEVKV